MALILILAGCNDEIISDLNQSNKSSTPKQKALVTGVHDILGYGYDASMEYLNPNEYDKHQVIDVDRLFTEDPALCLSTTPNTTESYIYAGGDAKSFSLKLSAKFKDSIAVTDMVSAGIKKDLAYNYSISSKNSYAAFMMTISLRREALHQTIEVLRNYISSDFVSNLNTSSNSRILKLYGTHVLTDITIGGKLQLDYKSVVSTTSKELVVNSGVSANAKQKFNLEASNSVGIQYEGSNDNVRCSYTTYGGNPGYTIFGTITSDSPVLIYQLNTWSQTVTLANAEIVDIGDRSLIPIYEFVLDPVRKQSLKTFILDYLNSKRINVVDGSIRCGFSLNKTKDRILPLDYNGDGVMDIICFSPGYRTIYLNQGLGDGTFVNVIASSSGLGGYDLSSTSDIINVLDYDGNGKDDLMCYRPGYGHVFILKSNGDGTFTTVYASATGIGGFDFNSSHDKAIKLDYNSDGKDDLMCFRPGSGTVFILKSNGNGTFTKVYSSSNGIGGFDFKATQDKAISFDYNGDGLDDILSYRSQDKKVFIAKSNGNGSFTNIYASSNGIGGFDCSNAYDFIIPLNYNGDTFSDLLCFRPGYKIAFLLKSNGNGTFASVMQSRNGIADFDLGSTADKIIALDYNNDNNSDLILYRPGVGTTFSANSTGQGEFRKDYPY